MDIKPRPLAGAQTVFVDGSPKGNVVLVSQDLISQVPFGHVSAQAAEITACFLAL